MGTRKMVDQNLRQMKLVSTELPIVLRVDQQLLKVILLFIVQVGKAMATLTVMLDTLQGTTGQVGRVVL